MRRSIRAHCMTRVVMRVSSGTAACAHSMSSSVPLLPSGAGAPRASVTFGGGSGNCAALLRVAVGGGNEAEDEAGTATILSACEGMLGEAEALRCCDPSDTARLSDTLTTGVSDAGAVSVRWPCDEVLGDAEALRCCDLFVADRLSDKFPEAEGEPAAVSVLWACHDVLGDTDALR